MDGYLTSGSHAKAGGERKKREERCEGGREQPFKKEEGEKAASQQGGTVLHKAAQRGQLRMKKSWKEGNDGEE